MIVRDTLLIRGGCCRVWFGVRQKEDEGGWCVRSPTNGCWCCRVLVGRDGWIWGVTNLRSCFATGRKKKKGTARNILVRSWCLAQWLFLLLASPPLHDKSDVCLLLEAYCVLISGSLVVFLRLCSGVTGHVLTHPERPHLKNTKKQAQIRQSTAKKKNKITNSYCHDLPGNGRLINGFVDWKTEGSSTFWLAADKMLPWARLWTESGTVLQAVLFLPLFQFLCVSVAAIVGVIYSEISLLTPTALVLNERPVKLMGQIQSFLVTHFTTHAHTRAQALQLFFSSLIHTNIGLLPLLCYRPAWHQDVVSASQEI